MPNPIIYTIKPSHLTLSSFYPRNYNPIYIFVKNRLERSPILKTLLIDEVKGGSTPPYYLFKHEDEGGIPFVKTSAIDRDFINLNDLYYVHPEFHKTQIHRSITKPYDVIYSMTGKFMGKAALCPPCIPELNMSQNSVVLRTKSPLHSAFLTIFLNSAINRTQVAGIYSITKQKYLNQGKIANLKVLEYSNELEHDLTGYINGINQYYSAVTQLKNTIRDFSKYLKLNDQMFRYKYSFTINQDNIDQRMLTPQFYRTDYKKAITLCGTDDAIKMEQFDRKKGDEIGSKNYEFEGIPFIKTSDFINYDVDYQPDYYCSDVIYDALLQNLKRGDILVAKDGKVGEIALIQYSAKIVICSGLVRIRPNNENDRYWLFLLLASNFGRLCFDRWTIIASTMAHLRKDFFPEFNFPNVQTDIKTSYISNVTKAFISKENAISEMEKSKTAILERWKHYIEKQVNA